MDQSLDDIIMQERSEMRRKSSQVKKERERKERERKERELHLVQVAANRVAAAAAAGPRPMLLPVTATPPVATSSAKQSPLKVTIQVGGSQRKRTAVSKETRSQSAPYARPGQDASQPLRFTIVNDKARDTQRRNNNNNNNAKSNNNSNQQVQYHVTQDSMPIYQPDNRDNGPSHRKRGQQAHHGSSAAATSMQYHDTQNGYEPAHHQQQQQSHQYHEPMVIKHAARMSNRNEPKSPPQPLEPKGSISILGEGGPTAILVENLHPGATPDDIKTVFARFGDITQCTALYDQHGRPTGRAEILYALKAQAELAIDKLDLMRADGYLLRVQLKPKNEQASYLGDRAPEPQHRSVVEKSGPIQTPQSRYHSTPGGKLYSDDMMRDASPPPPPHASSQQDYYDQRGYGNSNNRAGYAAMGGAGAASSSSAAHHTSYGGHRSSANHSRGRDATFDVRF